MARMPSCATLRAATAFAVVVKGDGRGGKFNTSKVRPSAGAPKVVIKGDYEQENITTVAYYNPAQHAGLMGLLESGDPLGGTTLTFLTLDEAGIVVDTRTYSGCAVESYKLPGGDTSSDKAGEVELTWQVAG